MDWENDQQITQEPTTCKVTKLCYNHLFDHTKYVSNARSGLVPVDTNKMPCPLAVGHPMGEEMKQKHDYGTVKNEYTKGWSDTDKGGS